MVAFEFDPNQPIYLQIIAEIKKRFVRGVYAPGAKLPSVRDMAREMRVNPNTMSRAYAELDREGFIFTRRGQGSFVTEKQKTIEAERQKLAQRAVAQFVAEVGELALSKSQIATLLHKIEEDLT